MCILLSLINMITEGNANQMRGHSACSNGGTLLLMVQLCDGGETAARIKQLPGPLANGFATQENEQVLSFLQERGFLMK